MPHMQFGAYLWPNRRNSRALKEIGVGEHDDDVRFLTGSHGLVNSAMGQIPYSTERISSLGMKLSTACDSAPKSSAVLYVTAECGVLQLNLNVESDSTLTETASVK